MATSYPGQNTDIYIIIDGRQQGPYHGLAEVYPLNITPDTPVWYDGLKDWTPAMFASVTRQLFEPGSEFYRAMNAAPTPAESAPAQAFQTPSQPDPPSVGAPAGEMPYVNHFNNPDRPRSYVLGSVLTIILFNMICGIIALVYSFKTRRRILEGDFKAAARASEVSQIWICVGIVLGIIAIVAWPVFFAT